MKGVVGCHSHLRNNLDDIKVKLMSIFDGKECYNVNKCHMVQYDLAQDGLPAKAHP